MLQNNYNVVLKHTTVINVDEGSHGLPPDAGSFQEFQVADYHCPEEWSKDGVFVHAKEGDALWFDFRDYTHNTNWDCAVMPSIQKVNPLTGERVNVEAGLSKDPKQNYLRLPEQMWLDGYANDGKVYQFIFTKSGIKMGVSEFVLPEFEQDSHALAFAFFAAKKPKDKPNRNINVTPMHYDEMNSFYDVEQVFSKGESGQSFGGAGNPMWFSSTHTPQNWNIASKNVLRAKNMTPSAPLNDNDNIAVNYCSAEVGVENTIRTLDNASATVEIEDDGIELGNLTKASMGAGGRITQEIKTDCNTVDYYEEKPAAILKIYLASTEQFEAIMKKGKKQNANKSERFVNSGQIGSTFVPLIKN